MTAQTGFNSFRQQRPWLTYTLLIILLISIVLVIARLSLPLAARHLAIEWLQQHGMQSASIDHIELDLISGKARILGVAARNTQDQGFSLGELSLRWRWAPLSQRHLVIDNISLDNFSADFTSDANGELTIAGLTFPETEDSAPDTDTRPFTLELKTIDLNSVQSCYQAYSSADKLDQDICFNLGALRWQGDISYSLFSMPATDDLPLLMKGGLSMDTLKVTDNILKQPIAELASLQVDELNLSSVTDIMLNKIELSGLRAKLSTDSESQEVSIAALHFDSVSFVDLEQIHVSAFSLRSTVLTLRANQHNASGLNYTATLDDIQWQGELAYDLSQQSDDTQFALDGTGSATIGNTTVVNDTLKRQLLSLQQLNLDDLKFQTLASIDLKELRIDNLELMQRADAASGETAHIASIGNVVVDTLKLKKLKQLSIASVLMDDAAAYFVRDKNSSFEYQSWFPVTTETAVTSDKGNAFEFAISNFGLNAKRPMTFVDNSLKEPFSMQLHNTQLQLHQLDSRKPEQISHLSLNTIYDKNTALVIDADATPLADRPDLNGTASITGLDLRTFSTLARQTIGHSIRSGQLDASFKLKADKGILNSEADLTLKHFELRALNKAEAEQLNKSLGIPLNSSLSLLRDDNNNIHLKIPITGDINNPSFSPGDAIRQATTSAITTAALLYYTPYGAVLVADKLYSMATALQFEPLVLSANSAALSTDNKKQLDQIGGMLVKRPAVNLTLCGIATSADLRALAPDVTGTPSDAQRRQLLALAESRAQAVKDYLTTANKIQPSRLAVCEPDYLPAAKAPVVKISI